MTVLVTGASGLIGGRLVAELLRTRESDVRAASRTARRWPAGVEGVVLDLESPPSLAAACEGVDAVVHLASMPEVACAADSQGALRANGGGTLAIATAAAAAGVRRFVLISTFKVYGNNPEGRVDEATPTRPASHYAITHRVGEDYALSQHPNAVVLRLANGFGAPVDGLAPCWSLVVNDFCRQAVVDRRIEIRSDGLASRNFVPMGDVTAAIRAAIGAMPAGLYNLGSEHSMTLREMVERVATVCERVTGFRPGLSVGPTSAGPRPKPLDYRTDRLRAAGVSSAASVDNELESTIRAAQRLFGPGAE